MFIYVAYFIAKIATNIHLCKILLMWVNIQRPVHENFLLFIGQFTPVDSETVSIDCC